ncbi:MAG TPA: hypothetical protein VHA70_02575 [Bauldia sp.]|nr:hypothetical protein [Bauldia sp.]
MSAYVRPIGMLQEEFGEKEIAEIAEAMVGIVTKFADQAPTVAAEIRQRIADGVALRNRNLDALHAVLGQAKTMAGGDKLARLEVERRRASVALRVDGTVCAYVTVDDGLGEFGLKERGNTPPSGDYSVRGDSVTLEGARRLSQIPKAGGLLPTVDLLGAFVALRLAGLQQNPAVDFGTMIESSERWIIQ